MDKAVKTLDKETDDKVSFVTFIIGEFARTYRMNRQQAYLYLKQYGGLDFLTKHWWALHTDNPALAIYDINQVCESNGGMQ